MERMTPNRPLTHDLFKSALETFEVELKEIVINNLLDGIFYARLVCEINGKTVEIDSRTSDALAMAVRFECPIYTYEFILDAAGVILEENEENESTEALAASSGAKPKPKRKKKVKKEGTLSEYSDDDLNQMLEDVLADEDYERAAEIRDEIKRRSAN